MSNEEVTLKEYFESRLTGIAKEFVVFKEGLERRLDELNQLRAQVVSDRGLFTTRQLHDRLQEDVSNITSEVKSMKAQIAGWVSALGVFFSLVQIGLSVLFYHLFHK